MNEKFCYNNKRTQLFLFLELHREHFLEKKISHLKEQQSLMLAALHAELEAVKCKNRGEIRKSNAKDN